MMEVKYSGVILLFYYLPLIVLEGTSAQEEQQQSAQNSGSGHTIQFPGHDAFYIISGVKNNSNSVYMTEKPVVPTTYRPDVPYALIQRPSNAGELNYKPLQASGSPDCRDTYAWENNSPFRQSTRDGSQADTRLSVEALFRISNKMEDLILDKNVNLIFSPIGIASVLGQLMLAARGDSLKQMEELLAPGRSSCNEGAGNKFHRSFQSLISKLERKYGSEAYELSTKNALFYQHPGKTLNRNFERRLQSEYATELFKTDFRSYPEKSRSDINGWASKASRGKIHQLITEVPSRSTSAVISSVTYFKAFWENVFNKQFTGPGPFYLDGDRNGRVSTANFMVAEFELPYAESASLGCRILALPYTHNETALYVILPLGPPKRKRPPTTLPPIPLTTPLPQTSRHSSQNPKEDLLLVGRIQEMQTQNSYNQNAGNQNSYNQNVYSKNPNNQNPSNQNPSNQNAYSQNSNNQNSGNQDTGTQYTNNQYTNNQSAGYQYTGSQNAFGMRVYPSYAHIAVKRPQTFFYPSDSIIYPHPLALVTPPQNTAMSSSRQKRQRPPESVDPCNDVAATTSSSKPFVWETTTTSRPCVVQSMSPSSSVPVKESVLSPGNLHKLASRIGPSEFTQLVSMTQLRRVSIILPKLSISTNVKLRDALAALGAPSVIGDSADLSGAVEDEPQENAGRTENSWSQKMKGWWKVDEVWQESRLEVNEHGTEAASGTAVGIVDYGGDSVVFKVNTPFLAVLRHETTGAPIFWASIVNPS